MKGLLKGFTALPRTKSTATLCRRCLTTSLSSLPTFLPTRRMVARAEGCHLPEVSTATGWMVIPPLARHCSYFQTLPRWATFRLPDGALPRLLRALQEGLPAVVMAGDMPQIPQEMAWSPSQSLIILHLLLENLASILNTGTLRQYFTTNSEGPGT